MYLLSTGSSGGFTKADEAVVRAITEAGMAALASDVNSSPVGLGPSVLSDSRLREAIDMPAVPPVDAPEDALSLQDVFTQVANETLLNEYPLMSMAVVDKSGNVLARTGLAPELFDELTKLPALSTALGSDEAKLMSASLNGEFHAVKVSRPAGEAQQRRLLTIRAVSLGGGSFFRRVVGTKNPAGLVRSGAILGEPIGGAKASDLTGWVGSHINDIPPEGASTVFQIGEGGGARIGAGARLPGSAGKGPEGTVFVVLSGHTLGSTQRDMATALSQALGKGGLAQLNWILVGGLLVISLGLTFYLPYIEFNTPLRRLANEFNAITEGRQHELHHDTYGGELGKLGRSAQTAMEALRASWEQDMADEEVGLDDEPPVRRTRSATRSLRTVRRPKTRNHRKLTGRQAALSQEDDDEAIDLPGVAPAKVERHAAAEDPKRKPKPKPKAPPAPAPTFNDEISDAAVALGDDDDSVSFEDMGDSRERYYREIYDDFVETKSTCGENVDSFTYEKFAKKLRKQSDVLLARADVKDVEFSVYIKDGKAALKAKVIKV